MTYVVPETYDRRCNTVLKTRVANIPPSIDTSIESLQVPKSASEKSAQNVFRSECRYVLEHRLAEDEDSNRTNKQASDLNRDQENRLSQRYCGSWNWG